MWAESRGRRKAACGRQRRWSAGAVVCFNVSSSVRLATCELAVSLLRTFRILVRVEDDLQKEFRHAEKTARWRPIQK